LAKELKNLEESPPERIKVIVNDDDFTTICADIEGPGEILSRVILFQLPLLWVCTVELTYPCDSADLTLLVVHVMLSFAIRRFSSTLFA
jgi:hypothetical protein